LSCKFNPDDNDERPTWFAPVKLVDELIKGAGQRSLFVSNRDAMHMGFNA
jgi:hypothetical protein